MRNTRPLVARPTGKIAYLVNPHLPRGGFVETRLHLAGRARHRNFRIRRLRRACVRVRRADGTAGLATGFYVDAKGTVATADHVVYDVHGNLDAVLVVITTSAQTHAPYRVERRLPNIRAVLLTPVGPVAAAPVRLASSFERGEPVMVVGWPKTRISDDPAGFVTRGYVAGADSSGLLVLDMRSAPGASGAPVFNRNVEVVAIMDRVGIDGAPFAYAADITGIAFE